MLKSRAATQDDAAFVWRTHLAALGPYIAATWGWDDADQERRFHEWWAPATHQIIVLDDVSVGFFRVQHTDDEIFLASIQIEPAHQRRGIGTAVVREFLDEARRTGRHLRLTVLRVNPARALYERLGFRVIGENTTHFEMLAT